MYNLENFTKGSFPEVLFLHLFSWFSGNGMLFLNPMRNTEVPDLQYNEELRLQMRGLTEVFSEECRCSKTSQNVVTTPLFALSRKSLQI